MDSDFPNSVIERLLYKRALSDKKYLGVLCDLFDSRWFEDKHLGVLLNLAVVYYKKYSTVPTNSIITALLKKYTEKHPDIAYDDVYKTFVDLSSFNMQLPDDVLSKNIQYFIRNRALFFAVLDNYTDIAKNGSIDECLKRFDKANKATFDATDLGMDYFSADALKSHWDYIMNPEAKIKTGWDGFDKITNGGFFKNGRSLYIFMGQAGLGKSVFLSNMTVNFLKQNLSVVVISLEMSQDVYAMRFDAHISGNNVNRLMLEKDSSTSKIKDFYQKHPDAKLYIKEYPPRSIRSSDIELYLDNLIANGHHFDVVIIDYLNLVLAQHGSDNMYKDALDVSEKLRALSYKFSVPIISAVQANSEGMNNENIGMEHIAESRGIAHTADFITALYQLDDDRENGVINCRILKNRLGGKVGQVIPMKLNPENLILSDISLDAATMNANANVADTILNNVDNDIGGINGL